MTLVVGVDSSLTGTGRAVVDGGKPLGVNVLRSTGKRADTVPQRQQRIRDLADRVTGWGRTQLVADWPAVGVVRPDLVVIEGPSHASRGGSPWDRAGLWWAILVRWQGVPVAVVPPSCRAKWATGEGQCRQGRCRRCRCPPVPRRRASLVGRRRRARAGPHGRPRSW
jgi:hypothetical protein